MTPSNISHAFYSEKVSPSNDSKQKDDNGDMNGMSAKLLKSRTVIISQQVNSEISAKVLNQLVCWNRRIRNRASPFSSILQEEKSFPGLQFLTC